MTVRARAFWTRCNLLRLDADVPQRSELQFLYKFGGLLFSTSVVNAAQHVMGGLGSCVGGLAL